jgi:hypothetical protein
MTREGVMSVGNNRPALLFRRFFKFFKKTLALLTPKNDFERLNNFFCILIESSVLRCLSPRRGGGHMNCCYAAQNRF